MLMERLVLLTGIALVAILVPAMGQMSEERVPTDDELLTYLRYEGPSSDDFIPVLDSIKAKEEIRIGGFTLSLLLYARTDKRQLMDDCQYVSFPKSSGEIDESDLTLVLNVYNVVNDHNKEWQKACAANIKANFEKVRPTNIRSSHPSDDELVAKLREKKLLAWEVRIILKAIRLKKEVHLIGYSVQGLLFELGYVFGIRNICKYASFSDNLKELDHGGLTLVFNVVNFVYEHRKDWNKICARILKKAFEDNRLLAEINEKAPQNTKLLAELDEKVLIGGVRDKLEPMGYKQSFKIGELTVQEILDDASKDRPTIEDCHLGSFSKRRHLTGGANLVANIHNFIHYDQLVSFCAENFKQVYEENFPDWRKRSAKYFTYDFNYDPTRDYYDTGLRIYTEDVSQKNCLDFEFHLDTAAYLMDSCKSESCKSGLEPIRSELEEINEACYGEPYMHPM